MSRKFHVTVDKGCLLHVQGPAMALRNDVQSGAMNLKEKLSIELAADARRGKVTYGGHLFNAKVCDVLNYVVS